jgi:hypothetical protein
LSQKRLQLLKAKSKKLIQPEVKQQFTMRFMNNTLALGEEEESDDEDNQNFLDLIDAQ